MPEETSHEATIEDYFTEERVFPPPDAFRERAVVGDPAVYDEAARSGPDFWAQQAGALDWFRPWDTVLSWDLPFARWFDGGTLNVSYNCLDRHVAAGRGDKVAYHWEGEPGDTRTISYADLLVEVCRFANVLRGLGVARGTGWPSTCRWCPSWPSPCWPAPGSGPSTRWSSAGSPRMRCGTGSSTPRPGWWSPPTAAGARARASG